MVTRVVVLHWVRLPWHHGASTPTFFWEGCIYISASLGIEGVYAFNKVQRQHRLVEQ